jgi:hypothetical protein
MTSARDEALAVLGLRERTEAGRDEVLRAFERLARRYPPRAFPERFERIIAARDLLLGDERYWRAQLLSRHLDLSWILPHLPRTPSPPSPSPPPARPYRVSCATPTGTIRSGTRTTCRTCSRACWSPCSAAAGADGPQYIEACVPHSPHDCLRLPSGIILDGPYCGLDTHVPNVEQKNSNNFYFICKFTNRLLKNPVL